MEDKKLLEGIKRGEEEPMIIVFQKYKNDLFRICYNLFPHRHEVEDAVQTAFLKLWQKANSIKNGSSLKTWLIKVALNSLKTAAKKQKPVFLSPPSTEIDSSELRNRIRQEIEKLPWKERTVIVLKDIEGLSEEEIAKLLKIPKGTVKSRLFRAREKLKEKMREKGVIE